MRPQPLATKLPARWSVAASPRKRGGNASALAEASGTPVGRGLLQSWVSASWLLLVGFPGRCGILAIEACEAAAAEVEGVVCAGRRFGEDEGQTDRFYFQREILLRGDQADADQLVAWVEG